MISVIAIIVFFVCAARLLLPLSAVLVFTWAGSSSSSCFGGFSSLSFCDALAICVQPERNMHHVSAAGCVVVFLL